MTQFHQEEQKRFEDMLKSDNMFYENGACSYLRIGGVLHRLDKFKSFNCRSNSRAMKHILEELLAEVKPMRRIRGEEKPYMWLLDEAEKFDGIPSNMDNKKIIGYNTALKDIVVLFTKKLSDIALEE